MDQRFFASAMDAVGMSVIVIDETTDFSTLNPHLSLWHSETYESPSERQWLTWVNKVEKLVGHSIDGNQDCDGYSIDFAYSCWEAGDSAELYAADVLLNKAAQDAAFGPRLP